MGVLDELDDGRVEYKGAGSVPKPSPLSYAAEPDVGDWRAAVRNPVGGFVSPQVSRGGARARAESGGGSLASPYMQRVSTAAAASTASFVSPSAYHRHPSSRTHSSHRQKRHSPFQAAPDGRRPHQPQVMNLDALRPHVPTTSSKQKSRRHPVYDLPVAEPDPAPHTPPSQSSRSPLFELQMQRISGGRLSKSHAKSLLRALNMAREYEAYEAQAALSLHDPSARQQRAAAATSAPWQAAAADVRRGTALSEGLEGWEGHGGTGRWSTVATPSGAKTTRHAQPPSEPPAAMTVDRRPHQPTTVRPSPITRGAVTHRPCARVVTPGDTTRASASSTAASPATASADWTRGSDTSRSAAATLEHHHLDGTPVERARADEEARRSDQHLATASSSSPPPSRLFVADITAAFTQFEAAAVDVPIPGAAKGDLRYSVRCSCGRHPDGIGTCHIATSMTRWLQAEVEAVLQAAHSEGVSVDDADVAPSARRDLSLAQLAAMSRLAFGLLQQATPLCRGQKKLLAFLWAQQAAQLQSALGSVCELQEEVATVDEVKAELREQFVSNDSHAALREELQALQAKLDEQAQLLSRTNMELGHAEVQIGELKGFKADYLALKEVYDRVKHVSLEELQVRNEELQAKHDAALTLVQRTKRELLNATQELVAADAALAASEARVATLNAEKLALVPRLPRRWVAPADVLTEAQRAQLDTALASGVSHTALVTLLRGANLKPYLPHIGLLKTEREFAVPREDFCRELSKGSTLSFLKQLGADTVKVLQQMLHHGVSSEDTASILYNETATGHTLEAVAQLVGALADVDAAPLAYMLQVADMSNEQQIATAKEEHEKTKHTLDVTRRKLEEAEAKLLNKSKRVEEKLRRFRQQKRPTPLEQFLDFDWADKPFFTPVATIAEGQGPIPSYLETSGKVRNNNMTKAATERIVKKVWSAKMQHDAGAKEASPLVDFVGKYIHDDLKAKGIDPVQVVVADVGYNFMWALKRWSYDADCMLFLQVLLGEVSESVYTSQRQQQFEFVGALAAVDVQKNGEEQGYLAKKHILALVRELFKKKDDQMEELVAAFDVQFPDCGDAGEVEYRRIFDEDVNCDQGEFAECLRDQSLVERFDYISELEGAMLQQSFDDDRIDADRARIAFRATEPDITEANLKIMLERLFGNAKTLASGGRVPVMEGMARIRRGVVEKAGPKPR